MRFWGYILVGLIPIVNIVSAQPGDSVDVFYSTYDDFVANNPVPGIKFNGEQRFVLGNESISIIKDNNPLKVSVKSLPYWGLVNKYNQLVRIYDGHLYDVMSHGKICSYIKEAEATAGIDREGYKTIYYESSGYVDYYSITPQGEIKVLNSDKAIIEMFSDSTELSDQFIYDTDFLKSKDKRINTTYKIAYYINKYNEE